MASRSDVIKAARKRVDAFANYDEEFSRHQALVGDETFGTIAYLLDEVQTLQRHDEQVDLAQAEDDLTRSLRQRAETVLDAYEAGQEAP